MSDIKIKISELESGDNLTRSIIDSAVIPIAVGALDSEVGETYKITLGEHYYDKDYINNQFNWIQEYVNKKISGIDISISGLGSVSGLVSGTIGTFAPAADTGSETSPSI